MHPMTVPIICLLGASAGKSKRRRKKSSEDGEAVAAEQTNGSGTKTRAQRIMEIQNGLARKNKAKRAKVHATQAAQVTAAAHQTQPSARTTDTPPRRRRTRAPFQARPGTARPGAAGPQGQPIMERMGAEIVLSPDGSRGFVGARWWAETGREICAGVRESNPEAAPAQIAVAVLTRVKSDVDWENPAMPAGVKNVLGRVERFVQASLAPRPPAPAQAPVQGTEAAEGGEPFSFAKSVAEGGSAEPIPPGVDIPHAEAGAAAPHVPQPGDDIPPGTYWEPALNRYVPPGDPEYNPAKAPATEGAPAPAPEAQAEAEAAPEPKPTRSRRGNRGGKGKSSGKGKGGGTRRRKPAASTEVVNAPPASAQAVGPTGDANVEDATGGAGGDGTEAAPEAT